MFFASCSWVTAVFISQMTTNDKVLDKKGNRIVKRLIPSRQYLIIEQDIAAVVILYS